MDDAASNIVFSVEELNLVQDEDLLRSKQVIIKKMYQLLADTETKLRPIILTKSNRLPEFTLAQSGKISKGENYRDLPYLVLDFPRQFTQEAIFAYRTMFWWGNFLSCTLHLQGRALDIFRSNLMRNLPHVDKDVFFCIASNPWEYHYEKENYLLIHEIPIENLKKWIATKDFIKISRKLPLEQYDQLAEFSIKTFEMFWEIIGSEDNNTIR